MITRMVIKKAVSVLLILLMVLTTFVPLLGASASDYGASTPESRASSRGVQNMTLYLKNTTTSHYVFDYSTTYIFDTSVGNRSEFFGDTHTVTLSWDMAPQLAGDFVVNGDVIIRFYMNTIGVSVNGNLQLTLKDISYKLDAITETVDWSVTSANTQVQIQSGVILYSVTIPGVNHTFPAGHGIGLVFAVSGGQSAYYGIWYGNATYDSRIEFQSSSHLLVNEVYTLDHLDQPKANFELNLTNKTVKIRANLSDPFGGYDINMVKMTLRDPTGTIVLNNVTMALIEGNPISFYCIYEYIWNFTGAVEGKYNITVWAVDNNGYNYYHHRLQYQYDGYWKVGYGDFWIGGLPANFHVKVIDSMDQPLAGAMVTADKGGPAVWNITNQDGEAGMAVFPVTYNFKVYWEEVQVGLQQVTVVDKGNVTIKVAVFYPTITVHDANGKPLQGASVLEVHPNGTVFLTPWITNATGSFNITRAPGGDYRFLVKWRDVQVADANITISANDEYIIAANVFTLKVTVQDSHGMALGGAQVVVTEVMTRIVFDSKLTNLQGSTTTQLPIGTYDIDAYWAETDVGGRHGYTLTANADIIIACDVFYVTVKTVDSRDVLVSDAQVLVLSNLSGSLIDSGRTDDKGLATLRLPYGSHNFQVFWKDIMVANGTGLTVLGDIPDTTPYIIRVDVFYAAVQVVDSHLFPLPSALITATSQDGGVFDFQQTNANGTAIVRVPKGTHVILVQWKGVDVANVNNFVVTSDIPVTSPFLVHAAVYYLTVQVLDSRDAGVSNAVVDVLHQNGEVADAGITEVSGNVTIRLPRSTYDLKVAWKDIEVGGLDDHVITADEAIVIKVAVYYVTFKIIDSKDMAVDLAHVTVYYESGAVFDSGITDGKGEIRMRLALAIYNVSVTWKDVVVGNLVGANVTADGTMTIKAAIYYVTFNTIDSRSLPVDKAYVTVYYMSGSVMDSRITDDLGIATMKLPGTMVNVSVVWRGTTVYSQTGDTINISGTKVLKLDVYYLTVQVKGVGGEKIAKAVVTVTTAAGFTYDAGKTAKNGMVEFRVAKGSYVVVVRFTTTYYMTSIDEKLSKPVTMTGDTTLLFKLKTYPPPIYTTVAFGLGSFIVILLVLIVLVALLLNKKAKDAALARDYAKEEAEYVGERPKMHSLKKHDEPPKDAGKSEEPKKDAPKEPVKPEEPKKNPQETPGPSPATDQKADTKGQQSVSEAPAADKVPEAPKEPAKINEDEEIDKALKELDDPK